MIDVVINEHGAVVIGNSLVVDGHADRRMRVVTHAHSDHLIGLERSLSTRNVIVGTPLTLEWLNELGYVIPESKVLKLDYGSLIKLDEIKFVLERTCHIPGSCQVVVEDDDGLRIVYTSDFKMPGTKTPIIESDILILDAVYGHPTYVRAFDEYIGSVLANLVKQLLSRGPVTIYGYHGKLQEVMELLRLEGIIAPYVLPPRVYRMTKIAERYGLKIKDYFLYESDDGREIVRSKWFVCFSHVSVRNVLDSPDLSHVILSGWEFRKPYRFLGKRKWLVAFSDHADFNGLISYIINSKPKTIIINSVRSSHPEVFAEEVRKLTGRECLVMPL